MQRFPIMSILALLLLSGAGCADSSRDTPEPAISFGANEMIGGVEPATVTPVTTVRLPENDGALPILAITMTAGNFFFEPSEIVAAPGQEVQITFLDIEGLHTFLIDEIEIKEPITEGRTITFRAPFVTGTYQYYCDVGAHRKLGMEGVLKVRSGNESE
jgi:plastocyanin